MKMRKAANIIKEGRKVDKQPKGKNLLLLINIALFNLDDFKVLFIRKIWLNRYLLKIFKNLFNYQLI